MLNLDNLKLRPMHRDDLDAVLRWRNAENVRRNMHDDHEISAAEHAAWFADTQHDAQCDWLMAVYGSKYVGVVGITHIDQRNSTCTWSMYLSNEMFLPGVGALMEFRVIDRIIEVHKIRKIWGETLSSNRTLLAMHRKFGFIEEGVFRQHVRRDDGYEDVVRCALFADQWAAIRAKLLTSLTIPRPMKAQG